MGGLSSLGHFLGGPIGAIAGSAVEGLFSAKAAKDNRDWQTYMSNTSHQREVADLRAAGLNPILSATGGSGASTPGGAVAQTPEFSRTAGNAKQLQLLNSQIENTNAQTRKTQVETDEAQNRVLAGDIQLDREAKVDPNYNRNKANADIAEAVERVATARQGRSSAQTEQRKNEVLTKALESNPQLAEWVLSAGYAEREAIDRMLQGNPSASDVVKFIMSLRR